MEQELTAKQLEELGEDLDSLKLDLESLLLDTESGARPVNLKDNQGRLSRMDEMHNQSILIANRNVTKNRLRKVIIARQLMIDGHYGLCAECDETISFQRLKAYPDASMCLTCQDEHEKQGS